MKSCKWDVQYQTTDWWRTFRSQCLIESVFSLRWYWGLGIDEEIPDFVKNPQSRVYLPEYTEAQLRRKDVVLIGAQMKKQRVNPIDKEIKKVPKEKLTTRVQNKINRKVAGANSPIKPSKPLTVEDMSVDSDDTQSFVQYKPKKIRKFEPSASVQQEEVKSPLVQRTKKSSAVKPGKRSKLN